MRAAALPALARLVACLFAASLAGAASAAAPADDDTFAASRRVDPHGLSLLIPERRRAPSGFLYPYPLEPPALRTIADGWSLRGFGAIGASTSWGGGDEAYFEEYADYDTGPRGALRAELRHEPSAGFLEFGTRDPGRDDGGAFLEAGLPGRLRVSALYDRLPHRYANDARLIHDGAGSGTLRLRSPLVPGGSSDADVDAVLAGAEDTRLTLTRETAGVDLRFSPVADLTLRAGYRFEEREGTRPFGGAIRFAFQNPNLGSLIETVEPRDARTHDFHAGVAWSGRGLALDLDYEGQIFDQEHEALTWENPFALPGVGVERGRQALPPDNLLHRIGGTLSFFPSPRVRWTNTLRWATAVQDDALLAPTVNPAFPDWVDPRTSLSRSSAEARTDTTVFSSALRLSPLTKLSLSADLRYRERDDRTGYLAYNPAVDSYGYVIEDGNLGLRSRYGAAPFDEQRWSVGGEATWRALARTRLTLGVEHERVEREQRARRETRETKGRVSLSTTQLPGATVILSYELGQQRGSHFDRDLGGEYYSVGPPDFALPAIGTPQRSLIGFEQVDLADRVGQRGDARIVLLLGEIGDLALATRLSDTDYDSHYGVRSARAADVQLELSLQYSPALDGYAFAGCEWGSRRLVTITGGNPGSTDLVPGGSAFPFDNAWSLRSDARTLSAGGGLSARPGERLELRVDYSFLGSRERLDYDYAGTGALAPGVTAATAGSDFPDLRNLDHVLDASAELTLADGLSLVAAYRLHYAQVRNFHQNDLARRIGHAVYLGHVDDDFLGHVLGGGLKLRF